MWGFIVFAILGYIGYTYKRGPRKNQQAATVDNCPSPATRAEQQGDLGERSVDAELRRILTRLCGSDFYLHPGALLVEHAPGSAYPTAEIDHLPVTPFGIFVVETKNWTGTIRPGAMPDTVDRIGADGIAEQRRSPDAQNRTKVAFLRGMLPAVWPVQGVGVFASPHCTVSPDLPISLVHISELEHWLRARKAAFESERRLPVDVELASQGIRKIVRDDAQALRRHRQHLQERVNHQGNT